MKEKEELLHESLDCPDYPVIHMQSIVENSQSLGCSGFQKHIVVEVRGQKRVTEVCT